MEWKYGRSDSTLVWHELKEDLLEAFGRPDPSYTFEEKFQFLTSLFREESETFASYLWRVQWVLSTPLTPGDPHWRDIVFLLGLSGPYQAYFLEKIKEALDTKTSLQDIVRSDDVTDFKLKAKRL